MKLLPYSKPEILVVDDFYDDLSWLGPFLDENWSSAFREHTYPGLSFHCPRDKIIFALKKIEMISGLKPSSELDGIGQIRLTMEKDLKDHSYLIHAEESWNILIHLAGREGPEYGTFFYRHRDLNMTNIQVEDPARKSKLYMIMQADTKDLNKWEVVENIPFKVNRVVIFNGRYFHSPSPLGYGHDRQTARVTQNFFLHRACL